MSTLTPPPALRLTASHDDRRNHKRFDVARQGKVFRRLTQQFAPITTRNLSFGGALLEVAADRPFVVGEIIDVGVAFNDSPVVNSQNLVHSVVIRVDPPASPESTRQTIAVRYINPATLVVAA